MLKALTAAALVVLALTSGWAYLHFVHDPHIRAVVTLEHRSDSLDQVVGRLRADSVRIDSVNRKLADSAGVLLRLDRRRIVRVTDTLMPNADSLARLAHDAVADSARPIVMAALAAKDTIIDVLMGNRNQLVIVIAIKDHQISLRDTALAATRTAMYEALAQRDAWRKIARPPLALRILRDLPKLAIGGAIIWIVKR